MASYTGFMALILLSSTAFGATSDECITQAEQRISRLELLMNEREAYTGKKQSAEKIAHYDEQIRLEKSRLQANGGRVSCASVDAAAQPAPTPCPDALPAR